MPGFSLIYSTFANQESAEKAAKQLLQKRLIGCAVFIPSKSMYWWKGQLETTQEVVLLATNWKRSTPTRHLAFWKFQVKQMPAISNGC